ncbi:FAD/NAD-P-binding domain-containing protein [Daedaleopsis nitida]|nr:FAD/NAD-P-binding domain-containing protein [Daedaleopsis nitida]
MSKFRIAICGGGIGGLTLAIALGRYASPASSIEVDIYEADSDIRTVGAGITAWPRTWGMMRDLGLYEDLSRIVVSEGSPGEIKDTLKPVFVARKADQPSEGYQFCRVLAPTSSTTMHRGDMVDVFRRHIPPAYKIHTSKRLVKYSISEPAHNDGEEPTFITMHFADGTTAEADVLVGADGIHSPIRVQMYQDVHNNECGRSSDEAISFEQCERCAVAKPSWTGVHAYRALIPADKLFALNPNHTTANVGALLSYSGKGAHIISYLISGGKYLNFVALCRTPDGEGTPYNDKWVADVPREELATRLAGWEPEVQQMVECIENPSRWAMHTVDKLPFAVSGNVTLLGDAKHAMGPTQGAGGGQAIEDAYILGRLLADPRISRSHIPAILRVYENVRLSYAKKVARRSWEVWRMYEFNAPGYYDGSRPTGPDAPALDEKTKQELLRLGDAIHGLWEWQWTETVDEQWAEAERGLRSVVGK